MPQENVVADQPQSEQFAGLLGHPEADEPAAEPNPEPTAAVEEATEVTEPEADAEPEAVGETEAEPTAEEWLESLTPNERAQYSKRYPTAWKALTDPNQPEDVKQLFRDKINSDFEITRLKAGGEPTTAEPEAEEAPAPETVAATPDEARTQYYQQIDALVEQVIDPKAVEEMGKGLIHALMPGVDMESQDPEIKALIQNASQVGGILARGATDLINTVLPHVLERAIEERFPEFKEMHADAMYSRTWDKVRTAVDTQTGQPLYPELADLAYGSKAFSAKMRAAAERLPGFDDMVFTDPKTGRTLPEAQQAARKYQVLAKLATGQSVSPAQVRDAVETGKKLAGKADRSRAAGKALGAGQSSKQFNTEPPKDELKEALARHRAEASPFAGVTGT